MQHKQRQVRKRGLWSYYCSNCTLPKIVVMYFLIIRPQRKRDKENKEMLASLKVGDNVTTIGGVCGKIVNIRDDVLTLEVGKDKVKLVFERWAIRDVDRPIRLN